MACIKPFKGTLFNTKKIKDISKVVSEPYDVISPAQQKDYYHSHPNNVIRLILGLTCPEDTSQDNQYTRAAKFLNEWIDQEILVRDNKESIYVYSQDFTHEGRQMSRTGFFVLLKLEEFAKSTVLPHENTFSEAVQDRSKLIKTTHANLSPIFALFSDTENKVDNILSAVKKTQQSCFDIEKEGIRHQLWRLSDKKSISVITKALSAQQIFIADGHHRYEAALNCKLRLEEEKQDPGNFNYVMVYLVAAEDRGLTILPTHRVLSLGSAFDPQSVLSSLEEVFTVSAFETKEALFSYMKNDSGEHIFGAYFGRGRYYGMELKPVVVPVNKADLKKDLDVTILHNVIIKRALNMSSGQSIYYTRDAQEALGLVDSGKYQAVLFLRPTKLSQVKDVAQSGGRMPHKSTYFYPKVLTGMVINKFDA